MQPKLGILAGGGLLPVCIVKACLEAGRPFHVITFEGQVNEQLPAGIPCTEIRLGAGGKTLRTLREQHVDEIILVGSMQRPTLAQLRPDAWGIKFLARHGAMGLGDDGLLSVLLRTLEEEEGFRVVGVRDVAPTLMAPVGNVGTVAPLENDLADVEIGVEEALDLGTKDIGQGVVVRKGEVIAREDRRGTDAMLNDVRHLQSTESKETVGASGVLVKVAKPQQERRADLPTIGVDTVNNAAEAGLSGIVVEADGALILEQEDVATRADALGVFVCGVKVGKGRDHA